MRTSSTRIEKTTPRFCDGFSRYRRRENGGRGKKFRLGGNEITARAVVGSSAATLPEVKA
jgi:hypothetical protein